MFEQLLKYLTPRSPMLVLRRSTEASLGHAARYFRFSCLIPAAGSEHARQRRFLYCETNLKQSPLICVRTAVMNSRSGNAPRQSKDASVSSDLSRTRHFKCLKYLTCLRALLYQLDSLSSMAKN